MGREGEERVRTDTAEAAVTTHAAHAGHASHAAHSSHTFHARHATAAAHAAHTAHSTHAIVFRRGILLILINPLQIQSVNCSSSISFLKHMMSPEWMPRTLSKSVFKKCIFLLSFNSLGQYSSFISFFRSTNSTSRDV